MRKLILLFVAASTFAADLAKLHIFEMAKRGENVEVAKISTFAAAAYGSPHMTTPPTPVFRLSDVPFLGAGRKEKLDLYFPSGDFRSNRPAVVFIHGGGFTGGGGAFCDGRAGVEF